VTLKEWIEFHVDNVEDVPAEKSKSFKQINDLIRKETNKTPKDGTFYAMKVLRKMRLSKKRDYVRGPDGKMVIETAWDKVQSEISLLRTLNNDNIVRLLSILDFGQKTYLIFELCEGGSSMEWSSESKSYFIPNTRELYSEHDACRYVADILMGLAYLHLERICHRDIKPQNLLIAKGRCKISDFGVAVRMDENSILTKPGTDGTHSFFPPEYCGAQEDESSTFNGEKVDVWCVGISMHAFIFGKIPFCKECLADLFDALSAAVIPMIPEFDKVGAECRDVLFAMLTKDSVKRPTAVEVLRYPWFLPLIDYPVS